MIDWGRLIRKLLLLPPERPKPPAIIVDDADADRRTKLEEQADKLSVIASNVADRHSVSADRVVSKDNEVRDVLDALLGRIVGETD